MEPTVYAALALHGQPGGQESAARAWALIRSWQRSDGSWQPSSQVREGTWVTALGVILCAVRADQPAALQRGTNWLASIVGAEANWISRTASLLHLMKTDVNVWHEGWPWRPGNSAWIEPTSLTLVALKKAGLAKSDSPIARRIHEGEELVLNRKSSDGGWNCGNPNVLHYDLPSYPETTGLALLGLQGRPQRDLGTALNTARRFFLETHSPLARAWLSIALRCWGDAPPVSGPVEPLPDVLLTALEALAHPQGNFALLRAGVAA